MEIFRPGRVTVSLSVDKDAPGCTWTQALLAPGGTLILAGFIRKDEAMVLNAYRMQGLRLVKRFRIAPWTTLVLRK